MKKVLLASGQGGGNRVPVRNGLVTEYSLDECRNLLQFTQRMREWSRNGIVVTPEYALAPDGTTTADRVVSSADDQSLSQTIYVLPGRNYVFSWYVKNNGGAISAPILIWDITNSASIVAYTETFITDSWVRRSQTFTTPAGCYAAQICILYAPYEATADALYWGAQLEEGSVASTYVPVVYHRELINRAKTPKNLIVLNVANCGEDGTIASLYAAWGDETIEVTTTSPHQGTYCAKCTTVGGGGGFYFPRIVVKPNTTYTLSGWGKTPTYFYTSIETYIDGNRLGSVATWVAWESASWTKQTLTFTTANYCNGITICLIAEHNETMYIDEFQLEEAGAATTWLEPIEGTLGSQDYENSNQPAWVGQGLYFAGNDYVRLPLTTLAGAHTIITVVRRDSTTGTNTILSGDGATNKLGFLSGGNNFFWRPIDGGDYTTYAVAAGTGYHTIACVRDAAGVCSVWADNASGFFTAFGGDAQSGAVTYKMMGVDSTANANYYDGYISFSLIYNRALTLSEVKKVYSFLKSYLYRERGVTLI